MKKVPFILMICTLLVSSCFYLRMYHFCEGDLEWMSPYEQGDTILFKSHEQIDTMIVQEDFLYNGYWPFRQDEGTDVFIANCGYRYSILHDRNVIKCSTFFLKIEENKLEAIFQFRQRQSRFLYEDIRERQLQPVRVNGIEYDDVIIVDDSNSETYDDYPYNCEFIWSKSKGLIQYKYLNGETYTFYKKLPYKKSI